MRTFTPNEYNAFKQLTSMSQKTLKKSLSPLLKKAGYNPIETESYIYAEGDIPIALVAHLDTVFKFPPKEFYYDRELNTIWSPDGLGADDRAGVYAILQIIRSGLRPHIIFTTDEEKGGIGAYELAGEDCPFEDLRYIIELDRQGAYDCIFYDCYNTNFISYVESFGFKEDYGTFSDISILCPFWEIAGVNLSIGYKNEHSYCETFNVSHFFSTVNKVKNMLRAESVPTFGYVAGSPKNYFFKRFNGKEDDGALCELCSWPFHKDELFPVKMGDGSLEYYCTGCVGKIANFCNMCNEFYEFDGNESNICPECRSEINAE